MPSGEELPELLPDESDRLPEESDELSDESDGLVEIEQPSGPSGDEGDEEAEQQEARANGGVHAGIVRAAAHAVKRARA